MLIYMQHLIPNKHRKLMLCVKRCTDIIKVIMRFLAIIITDTKQKKQFYKILTVSMLHVHVPLESVNFDQH